MLTAFLRQLSWISGAASRQGRELEEKGGRGGKEGKGRGGKEGSVPHFFFFTTQPLRLIVHMIWHSRINAVRRKLQDKLAGFQELRTALS